MRKEIIATAAALAVLGAFALTGSDDIAEANAEAARYCERVQLGIHRDWNADIQCKTKGAYKYQHASRTIAVM